MKRLLTVLVILGLLVGVGSSLGWVRWEDLPLPRIEVPRQVETTPAVPEKVRVVEEESAVIRIVQQVRPSVVTVKIKQTQRILEFSPFDPFGFFTVPREKEQKIERNIGSGFFVTSDGWVVTNKHVVSKQDAKYEVLTVEGKTLEVVQIYRDPANDLAILKVKTGGNKYQPLELGDSDKLQVGQTVIAIGTPLGEFQGTVTKGIISGLGRGIEAGSPFEGYVERLDNIIQTDAAINPGNSGGPLVNLAGQVIGVNTAVASGAENIGFAIPINVVKEALANFRATGSFQRAFLGVAYRIVSRKLSILNNIPEGAYIERVQPDSPAEQAGIQEGDIILEFDGKRVNQANDLAKLIKQKKAGERVKVRLWREGKEIELTVALGKISS